MLREQNPGLSRRFSPENALVFEDYGNTALGKLLRRYCDSEGVGLSLDALTGAVSCLAEQRLLGNFGNAGAFRNLLSSAKVRMTSRIRQQGHSEGTLQLSVGDILGSKPRGSREEG